MASTIDVLIVSRVAREILAMVSHFPSDSGRSDEALREVTACKSTEIRAGQGRTVRDGSGVWRRFRLVDRRLEGGWSNRIPARQDQGNGPKCSRLRCRAPTGA